MKKILMTISLISFIFVESSYAETITWTGAADNNDWNDYSNWDTESVPTTGDDVVFQYAALVNTEQSIEISSLTLYEGISLYGSGSVTFSAGSIMNMQLQEGSVYSAIAGFTNATIGDITLDAPNINLIEFTIENATLSGVITTNAQQIILSGDVYINSGCSFEGGTISGNGVVFESASVFTNVALDITGNAHFIDSEVLGPNGVNLTDGVDYFFGTNSASGSSIIDAEVTFSHSYLSSIGIRCTNVYFAQQVSLNAPIGQWYFSNLVTTGQALHFESGLVSNKNISIQGSTANKVRFIDATIQIAGSSIGQLQVNCDAEIENSTFEDDVLWIGNVDFFSGTFMSRLEIGSALYPSRFFSIKAGGEKSILGFTPVYCIVNWDAGNITKGSATQIVINPGAKLNVNTSSSFVDANVHSGSLQNNGTININMPTYGYAAFPMRLINNGAINIGNTLNFPHFKSVELASGSIYVNSGSTLILGGFNHTNYIRTNTTFTGSGTINLGLGAFEINHNWNTGSLTLELCCGSYLYGSGTLIIPSGSNLYWFQAWTTLPFTINGKAYMEQNTPHITSNTVTVNGTLNWNGGTPEFHNNGKIDITPTGIFNIIASGASTFLVPGASNVGIHNCGTVNNQGSVAITVPFTTCNTAVTKGTNTIDFTSSVELNGTISPGNSPGTLTINPSASAAPSAIFEMEIIGNQHDQVASSGAISLDGTLRLRFDNPDDGTYTIVSGAARTGTFAQVEHAIGAGAYAAGLPAWASVDYLANGVQVTINQALPIELLSFTAQEQNKAVQLQWRTIMESNNKGFHVQRSNNGYNWHILGFVAGVGNSSDERAYAFTDHQPTAGSNYYRLLQEDEDGKTSFSVIRHILWNDVPRYTVFPNPTNRILTLRLQEADAPTYAYLRNSLGQIVMRQSSAYNLLELDVAALPTGSYWLEWSCQSGVYRENIIIVH